MQDMQELFTESARTIIVEALKIAESFNNQFMTTGHLLYVILKQQDSVAYKSLKESGPDQSGINIDLLLNGLEQKLLELPKRSLDSDPVYFTESTKLAIQGAFLYSRQSNQIQGEHLLASLFENYNRITRDSDDIACSFLQRLELLNYKDKYDLVPDRILKRLDIFAYLERVNQLSGCEKNIARVDFEFISKEYFKDLELKKAESHRLEQAAYQSLINSYKGKLVCIQESPDIIVGTLLGVNNGVYELENALLMDSEIVKTPEEALRMYENVQQQLQNLRDLGVRSFGEHSRFSLCMAEISCYEILQERGV